MLEKVFASQWAISKIKFTSSSTNADDAETFATITFRAKAIKDTAPNDIISVEEIDSEDHNDGTQVYRERSQP